MPGGGVLSVNQLMAIWSDHGGRVHHHVFDSEGHDWFFIGLSDFGGFRFGGDDKVLVIARRDLKVMASRYEIAVPVAGYGEARTKVFVPFKDGQPDLDAWKDIQAVLKEMPAEQLLALKKLYLNPGYILPHMRAWGLAQGTRIDLFSKLLASDRKQVLDAMRHELGHVVDYSVGVNPLFSGKWLKVMRQEPGHVSDYARTNELEDFAESFLHYLASDASREALQRKLPLRYQFIDDIFMNNRVAIAELRGRLIKTASVALALTAITAASAWAGSQVSMDHDGNLRIETH
jgi:hypothetical protein